MRYDGNSQIINVIDPLARAGPSGHPLCRMGAWPLSDPCTDVAFTALEAERLGRMKSPRRQAEMAGSFALRRRLIAEMAGGSAEEVEMISAADGAPLLLRPTGWAMSLANKDAYTVVALAETSAEIGVDIEIVREMDWRPALSMICSNAERAEFEGAPGDPASKLKAFFRMWTLKEAVLKSTGRGFRAGPKAVETPWELLLSPGAGTLQAFGGTLDFWTADAGDTIVSLVQKRV
jgi:4'-phosphopantetheinyl transferase